MKSAELIETAIGLLVIAQKAILDDRDPQASDLQTLSDDLEKSEDELARSIAETIAAK